jgi:hypothetical protein
MAEQYTAYMIDERLVEGIAGLKVEISDYSPEAAPTMTAPAEGRSKPSTRRPGAHRRIGQSFSRRSAKTRSDPPASSERDVSEIVAPYR